MRHTTKLLTPILLAVLLSAQPLSARSLTIEQARELALENNRTYLSAQQDVKIARADVTKARAGAFPNISFSALADRNFQVPSFFMVADGETLEIETGFKNSYGANLNVTQSIWSGGRVFTAMSIAKDYRNFSEDVSEQVAAAVVYQADVNFYAVALQRAQVDVLTKSLEAATQNLTVVEKMLSQGQVSEFEVLRARVEKSNLQPMLLQTESNLRLATKRLASFLGLDLNEEIDPVYEPVKPTAFTALPKLSDLTATALELRPEMRQANYNQDMRRKAIKIARAGYFPNLSAVANYNWQAGSNKLTLSENNSSSWTAGLRLTIPIFQGGRVRGEVTQAIAQHRQATLESQQKEDDIRLEVEEAYDRLKQATEALQLHESTIAQAEEGLRIANLRYESGVGTLLEVLSAQAALTQARQILAEATFAYRTARAGLKMATTIDLDE